jgi:hypothetical protein
MRALIDFIGNAVFALAILACIGFMASACIVVWGKWLTVGVLLMAVLGFIGLAQKPKAAIAAQGEADEG